jgi:hypothetical protein
MLSLVIPEERSFLLFHLKGFFSFVESAVRTDVVRLKRFVTLRAKKKMRGNQTVVSPTFIPPC